MTISRRSLLAGCGLATATGVALALVMAPAHAGTMTSGEPTSATAAPSSSATTTVTETDSRTTITLLVGQTLTVSLAADYDAPTVSGPALAQLSTDGGYPTGRPLLAKYRAATPGAADVRTQTDYTCLHVPPRCARPQLQWTVHVVVMPSSSSSGASSPSVTPVGDWPVVWISSPLVPNTSFVAPANISITVSARTDRTSRITKIDLYENGQLLGTAATAPCTVTWTDVPVGVHRLQARAYDDHGRVGISVTTSVSVTAPPPAGPAA